MTKLTKKFTTREGFMQIVNKITKIDGEFLFKGATASLC